MDYHGEFESDDERALVHIPMAMRYRLDKAGIKLTLMQWQALPMALRRRVLELPCDTNTAIDDFQRELTALIKGLIDENVTRFKVSRPYAWQRERVPDELNVALREAQCDTITNDVWRQLSDFRRYVLVVLARPGRVSSRLPSALQEFCHDLQHESIVLMDSRAAVTPFVPPTHRGPAQV